MEAMRKKRWSATLVDPVAHVVASDRANFRLLELMVVRRRRRARVLRRRAAASSSLDHVTRATIVELGGDESSCCDNHVRATLIMRVLILVVVIHVSAHVTSFTDSQPADLSRP